MSKKKDFDKIVRLLDFKEDKNLVLKKVNKYIEQYGISDGILDQLGRLYIYEGDYVNAKKYLTQIKEIHYISLINLLIAHFELKEYEEVIKIYNNIKKDEKLINYYYNKTLLIIERLNLYSKYILGIPGNFEKIDLIINYCEEKALKHIKKHTYHINGKDKHSIFNNNIDIENLFNQITNSIENSKIAYTDHLRDIYYFGYYDIGFENNKQCDYIFVLTIRNTNKIISMFPICLEEICDYYPINKFEELNQSKNQKTKKLSQIDKFNMKYNKIRQDA